MNVRSLVTSLLLLGTTVAFAQEAETDTQVREGRIQSALAALRAQGTAYIQLQGTQTVGTTATTLKTLAYFKTDVAVEPNVLNVEIRQYRNDQLVTRLMGDGKTFWTYNNNRFQYAANLYGRYSVPDYTNYRKDLIDLMTNSAGEEVAFVARLLREIFAGDNAAYRSWMPGVEPEDGTSDVYDVVYTQGDPPRRQITFDLEMGDTLELIGIDYFEQRAVAGQTRTTTWSIDILDVALVPAEFNFVPYTAEELTGWKPVVRARPGIQ